MTFARDGRPVRPRRNVAARHQGVGKGDRVILMLGNQVELWESMLAVAKLGAIIMPTTGALGPADIADRIDRGGAQIRDRERRPTHRSSRVVGDYVASRSAIRSRGGAATPMRTTRRAQDRSAHAPTSPIRC